MAQEMKRSCSERIEILEAALSGLYELCDRYAPVEPGPGRLRFLPGNGNRGHSIERELGIAKAALDEGGPFIPVTPDV